MRSALYFPHTTIDNVNLPGAPAAAVSGAAAALSRVSDPAAASAEGLLSAITWFPCANRYDLPRLSALLPQKSTRGLMSR